MHQPFHIYDPELLPSEDERDEDLFPPEQEGITWEHHAPVKGPHFQIEADDDEDCPF